MFIVVFVSLYVLMFVTVPPFIFICVITVVVVCMLVLLVYTYGNVCCIGHGIAQVCMMTVARVRVCGNEYVDVRALMLLYFMFVFAFMLVSAILLIGVPRVCVCPFV